MGDSETETETDTGAGGTVRRRRRKPAGAAPARAHKPAPGDGPGTDLTLAPGTLPAQEIAGLAARYRRASGVVMSAVTMAGTQIENRLEALPDRWKDRLEGAAAAALERAYRVAGHTLEGPRLGERGHLALATLTGALGGMGGIGTAVAELPLTVTVIFRALQKIAESYGYDPEDPAVRLECLQVFGAGSPLSADDGVNASFLSARVTITGATLNRVVSAVAPRFAAVLGEKLAAQAVPVLGSVAGAGINYAFLRYYQEMAHVRFGLKRLGESHGQAEVLEAFRGAVARR